MKHSDDVSPDLWLCFHGTLEKLNGVISNITSFSWSKAIVPRKEKVTGCCLPVSSRFLAEICILYCLCRLYATEANQARINAFRHFITGQFAVVFVFREGMSDQLIFILSARLIHKTKTLR